MQSNRHVRSSSFFHRSTHRFDDTLTIRRSRRPERTSRSIRTQASNHARAISSFVLCLTDTRNANQATAGASPLDHRYEHRCFRPNNRCWWRNGCVASSRTPHAREHPAASSTQAPDRFSYKPGPPCCGPPTSTPQFVFDRIAMSALVRRATTPDEFADAVCSLCRDGHARRGPESDRRRSSHEGLKTPRIGQHRDAGLAPSDAARPSARRKPTLAPANFYPSISTILDAAVPFALGSVYVNFMTQEEGGRVADAYGRNYERLVAVKSRYDPRNRFRRNQNIRPAAWLGLGGLDQFNGELRDRMRDSPVALCKLRCRCAGRAFGHAIC